MNDTSIEKRLLGSPAFLSLAAEQRVKRVLEAQGWHAEHGTFYRDLSTRKPREIDVTARRTWEIPRKTRDRTLSLDLLIEVKSAKGFHLLFTPGPSLRAGGSHQRFWIGSEHAPRKRFLRDLSRFLNKEQLGTVGRRLNSIAYPREIAAPIAVMVDPPSAEWESTAFRETNVGSEKELDNSVMWRSGQALRSAFRAFCDTEYRRAFEWTWGDLRYDPEAQADPVGCVLGNFRWQVQRVAQFHPIVVIESELWIARDTDVTRVPWCRFTQVDRSGGAHWWWDVVHSDSFAMYASALTLGYDKALRRSRARLRRPSV